MYWTFRGRHNISRRHFIIITLQYVCAIVCNDKWRKKNLFWILFAWNHYRVWRLVSFVSGVTITLHRSRGYCTKRIVRRLLWHRIPIQHQNKRVREGCKIYPKSMLWIAMETVSFTFHKYLLLFYGINPSYRKTSFMPVIYIKGTN